MDSVGRFHCPDCDRAFGSLISVGNHHASAHPAERAARCRQVMIDAGVVPYGDYPGAGKKWRSKCTVCHWDVSPRYADVARGQGACIYCAGKAVHPEDRLRLLAERNLRPLTDFPGNLEKWPCRCSRCKRFVFPRWNNLRRWGGCGWCAGIKIDPDDAVAEMRRRGVRPRVPFPGAQRR